MPQDIFERADALINDPETGYNFTDEAFKKHGSECGLTTREKFLAGVKHDLKASYTEMKRLYDAGSIPEALKPTAEDYMKLLLDEAYTIVNFHDALGSEDRSWISGKKTARWPYKFQSEWMKASEIRATTPLELYGNIFNRIYLGHTGGIRFYGAQLDAALTGKTNVKFASLNVPAQPKVKPAQKPANNPAAPLEALWASQLPIRAPLAKTHPHLWTV